jgi:betaine lipid synthase
MIPSPEVYKAIDNIIVYAQQDALFGICDFYVSKKYDRRSRQNNWFQRVLWRSVFELDGIHLGAERRDYLDHTLVCDQEYNGLGGIPLIPFLKVPYYTFIGHLKTRKRIDSPLRDERGDLKCDHGYVTSSFIYPITWEDPRADEKVMKIQNNDIIVSLASGGCNLLDMLLGKPEKVVGVDLNPAQVHLIELKVTAIRHLGKKRTVCAINF